MSTPRNSRTIIAAAAAVAMTSLFAAPASADSFRTQHASPPSTFGFAAAQGGSGSAGSVQTCSGVAACGVLKQSCKTTGEWNETASNGSGQPTSGTCTTD